jgi:hypothetical protein
VITLVDDRLRAEAETFRLRFGCEDCAHYARETRSCANGYPAEPHRDGAIGVRRTLEFCKEFELA